MTRGYWHAAIGLWLFTSAVLAASSADWFDAVRGGESEQVQALLKADPKLLESRTEDKNTALHVAALEGHAALAKVLLAQGAPVNARGLRDETPLHMAMYDGHREVAEILLAGHAEVDARDSARETPLLIAVRKGHRELVELLLQGRADINAKNAQEETPLHVAAAAGAKDMVMFLLSENADPAARDKAGRTPKMTASQQHHEEVVEVLTLRVGDLHDARLIMFEGVKAFSAEEIRDALRRTHDFFEIAHPLASLDDYLAALQQKVLTGYQHAGFADARVEVRQDAKAGRLSLKVEEGPRYTCGAVKVTGAKQVPVAGIIERLTTCAPVLPASRRTFKFGDRAPATNPLTEALAFAAQQDEAFWVKGDPAPLAAADLRDLKEKLAEFLHAQGLVSAKVEVRAPLNAATRTAELQVDVQEADLKGVVGKVEVLGARNNSPETVLEFVGLKPGIELTGALLAQVEDRLWRSARFLGYAVHLGPVDSDGRVPVQIQVLEYQDAPSLKQPLSATEQAQLKLRDWLAKLSETGEDLVCRLSGLAAPAPGAEFILSPRHGVLIRVKDSRPATAGQAEYVLVLRAGELDLYSPAGKQKLVSRGLHSQAVVMLHDQPNARSTNAQPFSLTFGVGLKGQSRSKVPPAPYEFDLQLPPVACWGLTAGSNTLAWLDAGSLVVSNQTRLLTLDAQSGRLRQFLASPQDEHTKIEILAEAGAFERALQETEAATVALPDVADQKAPLSSALVFLAEEVFASRYLSAFGGTNEMTELGARLPALLSYLKLRETLAPLDALAGVPNPGSKATEVFVIPSDLSAQETTVDDLLALATGWVLRNSDVLFTPRTWPWTLLHEGGLVLQHKTRYSDAALNALYDSEEMGPIGYMAASSLVRAMQPPLGRKFAARGLECLSAADFQRDWKLLLTGDGLISQCGRKLALAVRDLDDAQAAALAQKLSPDWRELLVACRKQLRDGGDKPLAEVLAPVLDGYWDRRLKAQVSELLRQRSYDVDAVFQRAAEAYKRDDRDAVPLFEQAAAHGHYGAQYYLAKMYEQGSLGLTRDVAKALQYYYQAATNGFSPAAMILAEYYNEGMAVPRSHVEAFVWYGVAAARGDRMAAVFQTVAKRKLTPENLTAAEKKLSNILENLPKYEPDSAKH